MTRSIETFRFFRESGIWYIFLPGFFHDGGRKDDLRMRDGAGDLLSAIAGQDDEVILEISDDLMAFEPDWVAILHRERDLHAGADYRVYDTEGREAGKVWMSPPLRFYYGKYPDKFLLRRIWPTEDVFPL